MKYNRWFLDVITLWRLQETAKYAEQYENHVVSREYLDIAFNSGLKAYLDKIDSLIRDNKLFHGFDSSEIDKRDESFVVFLDDENISLDDILHHTLENAKITNVTYTYNDRWDPSISCQWTSLSRYGLIVIWVDCNWKIYLYM